jgi:3-hydroxybutyryl-CoA dehydrogenase
MAELPTRAAIVGGGTMGVGVATCLALGGIETSVVLRRADAVAETIERITRRLAVHERLGLANGELVGAALERVEVRVGFGEGYDVLLESVVESLDAKLELLARAERALAGDGVLCSNTSSLAIGDLAAAVQSPGRLAGWHWFHPADLIELVEVVPGPETRPETIERLVGWSIELGKTPVALERDTQGFVANRLQYALIREAYALVAEGACSVADVDAAVTAGLGPRWSAIGPFTAMDLAGLDVHAAVARTLFPRLSNAHSVPELLRETIARGALGAASGDGLRGSYSADEADEVVERRDGALAERLRERRS